MAGGGAAINNVTFNPLKTTFTVNPSEYEDAGTITINCSGTPDSAVYVSNISSSDTSIAEATLDQLSRTMSGNNVTTDFMVKPNSAGTVTLTATAFDNVNLRNVTGTLEITVTAPAPADDQNFLNERGLARFWNNIDTLKQDKLTAGTNITIAADNTISASQPTVGNATLTIQKNGTSAGTFTANATSNKTINITVPTKTSDITNDSNFVASGDLATVATSGSYNDLANKPTVPEIKKRTGASTTTNITPLYVAGDGTTTTPMALKTHGDDHTGSFAYVNINEPTSDISEAYIGGYVWDEYEDWWRKISEKKLALYSDIPTVNNATLTIQKNGSTVKTFTANASSNVTANITVPTKTSDLTNNSGFLTSSTGVTSVNGAHGAVTGIQTTSNLVTSVSSSSTNSQYPSAKLFYDTVGNVESVLQTLNSGTGV
jgi:hypothetical protein